MRILIILFVSVFLMCSLYSAENKHPPASKNVQIGTLVKLMKDETVILVDARSAKDYKVAHVPGAVHMGAKEFVTLLPEDKSTRIVVYCYGPGCTAWKVGVSTVRKLGYSNADHFKGGMETWQKKGGPLVSGVQPGNFKESLQVK